MGPAGRNYPGKTNIIEDNRFDKIRVLLATSNALLADKPRPEADLVLLKPISSNQMQQLTERFIGRPRQ